MTFGSPCCDQVHRCPSADLWPGLQTLFALFSVDDITGFKITSLLELPQPWGILVTWGCVLPLVFLIASALTNLVFKDGIILNVRPCSAA